MPGQPLDTAAMNLESLALHLVRDRQFHDVAVRLAREGGARINFRLELRQELVAPGKNEATRPVDLDDLAVDGTASQLPAQTGSHIF